METQGKPGKATAQVITEATDKAADVVKVVELRTLPFGTVIFNRPDRQVKIERTDKSGNKTGAVSELMAELIIPTVGNVLSLKSGIWRESRYDREQGQFTDTFSVSLPRNVCIVADGFRELYDAWRQQTLDAFDAWEQTASATAVKHSSTPRLVRTRKAEAVAPAAPKA